MIVEGCDSSEKRAELLYQQGMKYKANKQFQPALQQFRRALVFDPHHVEARIELGMLLCRYRNYAEGIKHLLKAREEAPLAFQPASYLGYAYQRRQSWMLAESYYALAIQLAPQLVDVRQYLADVLEAQGKREQAAQVLQELLSNYPTYERAAIIRARIAMLRQAESPEAYQPLADAHVRYGEINQGLNAYRRALSLPVDAPELLARFGAFCAEREQFEAAVTYLEQAIEKGWRDDVEVWQWLAKSQDMLRNVPAAIEAYRKVLLYQPDRADIRNRLLVLLERNDRQAEAADVLEQAFYAGYLENVDAVWGDILRLRGEASEKAVVRLTPVGTGEFLVDVMVEASHAATFLLDPQSEYTIISEELAQQLKILLSANTSVVHFNYRGQRYTPYLVNLSSVKVGELAVRNVKTLILDLSDVVPPIDGVLGKNFLKHFDMNIEQEHQLFVLTKPES